MAKNETAVLRWARTQRAGHAITKAVLLVLASHADRHGITFPSQRTIAEEVEVSPASVNRHVKRLLELGLIEVTRPGAGRSAAGYRLAVDRPISVPLAGTQTDPVASRPDETQPTRDSVPPEGNATGDRSVSPGDRSVSSEPRSVSRQVSDQQVCSPEVVPTELEEPTAEDAASRLSRTSARRAHTRGGGRPREHVPAAELNRTAHSPTGYALVADWAAANPGVLSGHRRELGRAVDQLLAQGADPNLVPAALTEAHAGRFRIPAKALHLAYEDIRRAAAQTAQPPAPAVPQRIPTTTQRVQGALALLRPDGDQP